ncbi:MurR/RpiR family transcriptional regulator [Ilyobacter polytropus]|uniref:Transcriptional regulator, RpiR family n=1 Tax=Ilyobacter polytropus (strain ATCC 51220 / DSM 2926 / LMG 16218 / CuHBu1) TaxID=572544 RepID=E3HE43_ILYPC|nr:SIS domain-containing protein [Ilyobacter polytropus]ADO84655.1 transcriptional regulator, RpiR family [Ilyobacter polytropus DSM 2926]
MIGISHTKLNNLEKCIIETINNSDKITSKLKIYEVAEIAKVSPSKISKLSKKLGFENYKQFIKYLSKESPLPQKKETNLEEKRIIDFLQNFNIKIIDDLIKTIEKYQNIILVGYGPSLLAAEYFAYKLKLAVKKNIITTSEEMVIEKLYNEDTILILFSVSGKFKKTSELLNKISNKGGYIIQILDEYNTNIEMEKFSQVIYLTKSFQDENLLHYEKSRSIFFIFFEKFLHRLRENDKL